MIFPGFDSDLSPLQYVMYLAILCNSKVIEMYGDKNRVSQRFRGCQMRQYIAEIAAGSQRTLIDDIKGFKSLQFGRSEITQILRTSHGTTALGDAVLGNGYEFTKYLLYQF